MTGPKNDHDCRRPPENGPVTTEQTPSPAPAVSEFTLHAWVDESIHTPRPNIQGMYVLASVVADPTGCDHARAALAELLPKGRARLHWRDESESLRRKVIATIATCDFVSLVVVGVEMQPSKQERARRKCLRRLLHEMENLGVSQVWLESRTTSLNRQDMWLVDRLRGERAIGTGLRVDMSRPLEESMLWVPDAIAGAVSAARKGGETEHRETLGSMVQEIDLAL